MPSDSEPAGSPSSPRRTLADVLTKLVHGSAPFISTFLLIHLTAPALASLGGSSLSSQVMILGREYYQTSFGNTYLLLTPLCVHTLSGLAKRLFAPHTARKLRSTFALAGYTSMLVLLPIHYALHHDHPADPAPPVLALAPAELDFEYVKYALHTWPWRSALLYAGLAAAVAWHAVEGEQILWNTYLRGRFGAWRATVRSRAFIAAAVVLPVLAGLFALWKEPSYAFMSFIPRYEAAFRQSWVYRL
ncbi:hypothetical protein PsYK624_040720 [Phanerochaete sordida]|uniref:Mitochondrial adapter protein MCP1 transmembrane domain-containing protein n=1 Tax=Phanerochaete sordida TaxID=48140 RepID=A0A9P3G514_9APHY|nr:hypothetical protein PsYK624_040720 [Phanerochaete sordida]